jgi:hypothetical protein
MSTPITKELLLDLDRLSEHKALRHSEREIIEGAANVLRKIQAEYDASQSTPAGEVTADAKFGHWSCCECGVTHSRDVNAAKNIARSRHSRPPFAGTNREVAI